MLLHCPKCDYCLATAVPERCSECGAILDEQLVVRYSAGRWPTARLFQILNGCWLLWAIALTFFGDLLTAPLDTPGRYLFKLPFFCVPLQLMLSIAAHVLLRGSSRTEKRVGAALVVILWLLVAGGALWTAIEALT